MSDYLPFEIQLKIIERLPVKSLIQFRSVSKAWKSLIDSSDFIAQYSRQHTQTQLQLLVRYHAPSGHEEYFSVVDDNTFPHQRVSLTVPLLVNNVEHSSIIGCCNGLLCSYSDYVEGNNYKPRTQTQPGMAVLWNLSIRKAVAIVVPNVMPNVENWAYGTELGFGVCRETYDPKIVKITQINRWWDKEIVSRRVPWQVEIFKLSTGAWRTPDSSISLPRNSITYHLSKVVVDGILYWLATDRITIDGKFTSYNLIISFDMTSEEFSQVNLPYSLAEQEEYELSLKKLHGSLAVIDLLDVFGGGDMVVWKMEDGVTKSFTKLFTINANTLDASICIPREFTKTGEPIIEIQDGDNDVALVVYEPYSKHINKLEISGNEVSFFLYPYMETLILLDQPDLKIYN